MHKRMFLFYVKSFSCNVEERPVSLFCGTYSISISMVLSYLGYYCAMCMFSLFVTENEINGNNFLLHEE